MKQAILFFLWSILPAFLWAQQDSGAVKPDSFKTITADSTLKIPGTLPSADSIVTPVKNAGVQDTALHPLYVHNKWLNTAGTPVSLAVKIRKPSAAGMLFYLLAGIMLLLACLKFFFERYFITLFRVFFNTSLRQSQLADQLLQARLPSLLFNLFFIISGGVYVYFLLLHYKWIDGQNPWLIIAISTGLLGIIYASKFTVLKFTGWITGYSESTNTYVFIIFLINKIIGIFLVPLTIIIAFSIPPVADTAVVVSMLCVGSLLLMRFFRSYGLIQHQLKISRLHFLLYIVGIEIVPLLLIYKALVILLDKNL